MNIAEGEWDLQELVFTVATILFTIFTVAVVIEIGIWAILSFIGVP